jgi:hypothetical protein
VRGLSQVLAGLFRQEELLLEELLIAAAGPNIVFAKTVLKVLLCDH